MSGYSTYKNPSPVHLEKRLSSLSVSVKPQNNEDYAVNRLSQRYDSYQEFLYRTHQNGGTRQRLSSTGETSSCCDSGSTGASSGSSDGSRADSEEGNREERLPPDGQITAVERQQVETFFKGLKTQVYVSASLANLYMKSPLDQEWQLKFTGIPVVILDVGESRARDKRKIQIALAERGTCFMLWSDTIDNLSSYKIETAAFHTMCYSSDHSIQIGFSFDAAHHANDMWKHIEALVACPENISLSTPGKKKKKKDKKAPKPPPLPPKSHISQPCCFQHITSVDREDTTRFYSLKELLAPNTVNARTRKYPGDE